MYIASPRTAAREGSIRAYLQKTTFDPLFVHPIQWNEHHSQILLQDIEESRDGIVTGPAQIIKVEEFTGKFRQKHAHPHSVIDFITHRDGMHSPHVRLRMMNFMCHVETQSLVRMIKGKVPILAVLSTTKAHVPLMLGVMIAMAQEQAVFLPQAPFYRVSAVIGPAIYSTSISSQFLAAWSNWDLSLEKLVLFKEPKTAKNLEEVIRVALSILRPGMTFVQIVEDDEKLKKPLMMGLKNALTKKWHDRNAREHHEI